MTNFWSATELNLAKELRSQGLQYKEIAMQLPGRTEKALRRVFSQHGWTKIGRNPINPSRSSSGPVTQKARPSQELLDERDRRANEYRSPSQIQFGDPPFSQSALAMSLKVGESPREKAPISGS